MTQKRMTQDELDRAILEHGWWLKGQPGGSRFVQYGAYLTDLDLTGANLSRAIIVDTKLDFTKLKSANLSRADLHGSNFVYANLDNANLTNAVIISADLSNACLRNADLSGALLHRANLRGASLVNANCSGASLSHANLINADLNGANLLNANLTVANLGGAYLADVTGGSIARLDFGGWSVCVRENHTTIGCQNCSNEDWLSWSPDSLAIINMDTAASSWWKTHGEAVKAVIRCVMSKAKKGNQE